MELVNQYLTVSQVSGELAQKVMNEALKYQGWKYVYGGSNPNTSFDCSGLTQWCYGKAGISLPRTAQAQYDATQHLPLSKAALASIGLMYAVQFWNDYTNFKIYINKNELFNFQMKLRNMVMDNDIPDEGGIDPNTIANAAVIVAILPFAIIYPFCQKYFVQGVNVGAVKE